MIQLLFLFAITFFNFIFVVGMVDAQDTKTYEMLILMVSELIVLFVLGQMIVTKVQNEAENV